MYLKIIYLLLKSQIYSEVTKLTYHSNWSNPIDEFLNHKETSWQINLYCTATASGHPSKELGSANNSPLTAILYVSHQFTFSIFESPQQDFQEDTANEGTVQGLMHQTIDEGETELCKCRPLTCQECCISEQQIVHNLLLLKFRFGCQSGAHQLQVADLV